MARDALRPGSGPRGLRRFHPDHMRNFIGMLRYLHAGGPGHWNNFMAQAQPFMGGWEDSAAWAEAWAGPAWAAKPAASTTSRTS